MKTVVLIMVMVWSAVSFSNQSSHLENMMIEKNSVVKRSTGGSGDPGDEGWRPY